MRQATVFGPSVFVAIATAVQYRRLPNGDECLEDKRGDYENYSVLCCASVFVAIATMRLGYAGPLLMLGATAVRRIPAQVELQ